MIKDLTAKVLYLIDTYNLWAEDDTFTFPDGDIWLRNDTPENSRRSVTTISIQIRLRIPPGSNTAEVLSFVSRALSVYKTREDPSVRVPAIDLDSMVVKLQEKKTTYL